MEHSQGLSKNPHPQSNQYNPHTDIYLFKIYSNIILGLPRDQELIYIRKLLLPRNIEKVSIITVDT